MWMDSTKKPNSRDHVLAPMLLRHNQEMARAASAAMAGQHAEALEICSELLTSGLYGEMESGGHREASRRSVAETRLLLGSAMHFTDAPYEDIVRVLTFALDSPVEIRKDALFTLAVVHLSFGHRQEAEAAMERFRVELAFLMSHSHAPATDVRSWQEQDREATVFISQLKKPSDQTGRV